MKKKNSKEAADFPGRFGALTWRPGDLMKNLETPGKTGRVDRYAQGHASLSHTSMYVKTRVFKSCPLNVRFFNSSVA